MLISPFAGQRVLLRLRRRRGVPPEAIAIQAGVQRYEQIDRDGHESSRCRATPRARRVTGVRVRHEDSLPIEWDVRTL